MRLFAVPAATSIKLSHTRTDQSKTVVCYWNWRSAYRHTFSFWLKPPTYCLSLEDKPSSPAKPSSCAFFCPWSNWEKIAGKCEKSIWELEFTKTDILKGIETLPNKHSSQQDSTEESLNESFSVNVQLCMYAESANVKPCESLCFKTSFKPRCSFNNKCRTLQKLTIRLDWIGVWDRFSVSQRTRIRFESCSIVNCSDALCKSLYPRASSTCENGISVSWLF